MSDRSSLLQLSDAVHVRRAIAFLMVVAATVVAQDPDQPKHPLIEGQVFDYAGSGVGDAKVDLYKAGSDLSGAPVHSVTTEKLGDFSFPSTVGLTGDVIVVFSKSGYARVQRTVTIEEGGLPPFVDVQLPGAHVFAGVVREAESEKPIAGAAVYVSSLGRDWRVFTGDDGTFRIEGTHPHAGQMNVRAEGFGKFVMDVPSLAPTAPIEVELSPERIIRLTVIDWRADPIEGADVEIQGSERSDYWYGTTDADGVVVFKGAARTLTKVRARLAHPTYVSDVSYAREIDLPEKEFDSEHRLTLFSAGTIKGKVTQAGTEYTLQGARISLGATIGSNQPTEWTDLSGTYELTGVSPGKEVVTIYLAGYAPQLREVRIFANQTTEADFELTESKSSGGVVVDTDGKPVEGAYIVATKWAGCSTLAAQTLTDENGVFELYNIPNEEFEVAIQAFKHDPLLEQIIKPGKTDYRFELKDAAPKSAPGGPAAVQGPKVGDPLPDLELTTIDGEKIRTRKLRGKVVLLDFWATWCGPCVVEIPKLVAMHAIHADNPNFVFVGISLDGRGTEKKVRQFIKKNKMAWSQVIGDANGADVAAKKCGVTFIPRTIIVGPDGKIHAMDLLGEPLEKEIQKLLDQMKK